MLGITSSGFRLPPSTHIVAASPLLTLQLLPHSTLIAALLYPLLTLQLLAHSNNIAAASSLYEHEGQITAKLKPNALQITQIGWGVGGGMEMHFFSYGQSLHLGLK